jgi:hypothetical protein
LAGATGNDFRILKVSQFPSKTAFLGADAFLQTAILFNLYGAILILEGFFRADPLPTPVFCRNMAKIVQLHSPEKFNY